jgi:hypothetical protein
MEQRTFYNQNVVFSVCKGAMNALRYWQLRDDASVETNAKRSRFSYPYGVMNLMAALAIRNLIANRRARRRLQDDTAFS